ncbi:hypothetical protein K449DRAFT_429289 [Hypoxylon sp. EC38]|nr:hypothetical protein K449DRAFT_429289 [Hypoxylon sp. EC38]
MNIVVLFSSFILERCSSWRESAPASSPVSENRRAAKDSPPPLSFSRLGFPALNTLSMPSELTPIFASSRSLGWLPKIFGDPISTYAEHGKCPPQSCETASSLALGLQKRNIAIPSKIGKFRQHNYVRSASFVFSRSSGEYLRLILTRRNGDTLSSSPDSPATISSGFLGGDPGFLYIPTLLLPDQTLLQIRSNGYRLTCHCVVTARTPSSDM